MLHLRAVRVAFALAGTDRGRSGIGVYVREVLPRLARALRGEGGSLRAMGSPADVAAYEDVLSAAGTHATALPRGTDGPAASALYHLAFFGRAVRAERADVLLLPAANRRLVVRCPVPTVAVVHDLAQLHVARKYDPARQAYFKHVVARALRGADRLVAVSEATRDDLAAIVPSTRIDVVLNGVDHERFAPMAADDPRVLAARRAAGIEDAPYLLYTSRLEHPGKNHLRLLRAFASSRARDAHVLLLAGRDWGAERLIRDELARLALGDRVRLLGFVTDEDLPALVAGAAAVCMVGLREGFGLPALEALSAGRPVIAASTGALPEVVGDLGALCDPFDEQSIRSAIDRALFDEELRARVHSGGPARAASRSWDRTAEGLLRACRDVVASAR